MKITERKIAVTGVLVALAVVLSRLLGITTPIVKFSLEFIPVVVAAMCFGPVYACIVSAMADFIGAILFPVGAFNPAFTVVAAMSGLTYGLLLYRKKPQTTKRMAVMSVVTAGTVCLVYSLAVNTALIHWFYNVALASLLPTRLIQVSIMIPLQSVVILGLRLKLVPHLSGWSSKTVFSGS